MLNKIYERKLAAHVTKYLHSPEAIVIMGARQVGKTSLLKYLIDVHLRENVFYFDLELRELLDVCNQGAEEVYQYLLQKGADGQKKIYLLIDEVQYLDEPTRLIKIFHDHYPQVKLLLSGSSTFEMKRKFKESLAGRMVAFVLYPLSFEEFLLFKEKKYVLRAENSKAINDELVSLAEEYIKFGGFPQIVLEPSEEKKKIYLSQIINAYVRKDIRDIGNIRNISSFNKLLEVIASQSGQLLNISELSNTLRINQETLRTYVDLLENTFILKRITPFHKNTRSELTKNPKVFMLDTGLMHLLWLKEFPQVILGNAFETFVFLELLKSGNDIHFWRTVNKQEVDFIVSGKKLYALEAKYKFKEHDTTSLKFFAAKYPCISVVVGLQGEKSGKGKYIWELIKELKQG
ncbi:ATP-binding protein, partial [Candidatus Woesearchaeota archaeon]|nr:ATP-binding protein [Candidatus Woesearchaeota archaeon]